MFLRTTFLRSPEALLEIEINENWVEKKKNLTRDHNSKNGIL